MSEIFVDQLQGLLNKENGDLTHVFNCAFSRLIVWSTWILFTLKTLDFASSVEQAESSFSTASKETEKVFLRQSLPKPDSAFASYLHPRQTKLISLRISLAS